MATEALIEMLQKQLQIQEKHNKQEENHKKTIGCFNDSCATKCF